MFIEGLLLGLTLQLSVGPVCLSVLFLSISKGFKEGFKMALGVTLVDGVYIALSFLGMASLLKSEALRRIILIGGACALIYFGLSYFISFKNKKDEVKVENVNSFLYGVKLTLTNPLTIVFWSSIFGSLIASNKLTGIDNILTYSLGCITSTIAFLSLISAGGKYASKILSPNIIKIMSYGVGLFLIYFGGSMLFKG